MKGSEIQALQSRPAPLVCKFVDISNPQAPGIVGSIDTPGNANDVRIVGNLAYIADGAAENDLQRRALLYSKSDLTSSQVRFILRMMKNTSDTTKHTDLAESLGATVRRLRKDQHLTQAQLAEEIGVDESYISKIETGRLNYTPSQETLRLLAQVLKADPLRLLALAEKTPDELKPTAESQTAREFFELLREQRLSNEDWQDLTHRLRHRLSKRGKGDL